MTAPAQTFGQRRVRCGFNPSGNDAVDGIKRRAAELIDLVDTWTPRTAEALRLKALAMTAIEEGSMWAVKAVTTAPAPESGNAAES
ncbi:MAG: hypothetical protein OXF74_02690 [Rhodobacteraceae bacterium]|nr:hypothetical protein [Paracoccaceae bacterium]